MKTETRFEKVVEWKRMLYTETDVILILFLMFLSNFISPFWIFNYLTACVSYMIIAGFTHILRDRTVYWRPIK